MMKLVWVLKKLILWIPQFFIQKFYFLVSMELKNSNGLSITYDQYSGRLKIGDLNIQKVVDSNSNLLEFYNYLSKNQILKV